MRDGEHICIMSTYGSFLHIACVFVLVCCKTLTFEAILVVDYVEGNCFSENIAKMQYKYNNRTVTNMAVFDDA